MSLNLCTLHINGTKRNGRYIRTEFVFLCANELYKTYLLNTMSGLTEYKYQILFSDVPVEKKYAKRFTCF